MLFEKLHNAKKTWKIPVLVVIILLLMGLLGSFAYLGSSFNTGTNTTATNGDTMDNLKDLAKSAGKSADSSNDDADAALAAANAYYNLAAYQQLYNEGDKAQKSYQTMKTYTEKTLEIYGSAETTDAQWQEAYQLLFIADNAIGDVDGMRASFEESLAVMVPGSSYLQTYASLLAAAEDYQSAIDDLNAAIKVLQPLADTGDEDDENDDENADAETPADVIETANSLIEQYQIYLPTDDNADKNAEED